MGAGPHVWWLALATICCADILVHVHSAATSGCPAAALGLSPLPHKFVSQGGQCTLDESWTIRVSSASELSRPAKVLSEGIRAQTGLQLKIVSGDVPGDGSHSISLQLTSSPPPPAQRVGFGSTDETYQLHVSAAAVQLTGGTQRGVQYAVVTFLQLLGNSTRVPTCLIDDKPDLPVRGFYLDSRPSNALNETFVSELASLMGGLKMNSLILHNSAFLELIGAGGNPIKPTTLARLQNISDTLAAHQIDMIAEIGPYYSFQSFEGLWVRNEPFRFSDTGVATPLKPALDPSLIGPRNPTFITSGADKRVDGWQFRGAGRNSPSPCRVDETTQSPTGGRTLRCDVAVDPRGAHAGGVFSDPFSIDAQAYYYVQAWVKVNGTGRAPSLVMGGANDSTANFGASLADTKGQWTMVDGTFASPLDSTCARDCFATVYSRFVGSGTATWWLGDLKILRLNGALLNVIRTNATDVNVTSAQSGKQYKLGVDFELVSPKSPPQHYDPPFLQMYQAGNEALTVRRLPSGDIKAQEEVLISYDFGTNMVGEAKPNDPVAMGEPMHFQEAKAAIDKVMELFPAPAVFFYETDGTSSSHIAHSPLGQHFFDSFQTSPLPRFFRTLLLVPCVLDIDVSARASCAAHGAETEVRGINRDSRSAKLGLSNADLLARDMNTLAGFVRANNPAVMPLFWCDSDDLFLLPALAP
eukprot:COSAG03_NODE_139_length_11780_cov_2.736153_8_plen_697_part_00